MTYRIFYRIWQCDTFADLASIPSSDVSQGDLAIIFDTQRLFIASSPTTWTEKGAGGSANPSQGSYAPYVILSIGTLTNGVHDQPVTGNVGHVGTETDTFTFVSGGDIAGSTILGTINTPLSPVGDAHILYQNTYALPPTFSYPVGAVDLATDVNSPDGIGVFKTGVYKITGACNIGAAGITLTGLGTFVFIVTGALNSTAASVINLTNGATADNVFFVSGGIVTLAAGTTFVGTVLSGPNAITTGANFNLSGRLISETTINLGGGTNTFTVPLFTPSVEVTDATISVTDVTTNNATTAKHGWLQKLPGGTSTFLRADGAFAAAGGAAADPSYSPGSFTVVTETAKILANHLKLTTTQRVTIEGTGRLRIL